MKKSILILVAIVTTIIGLSAFKSANDVKVIAVVNKANWCSVCVANGSRAVAAFTENNKNGEVQFIFNDVTDAATTKASLIELKKAGLDKAMENYKATGVCYFFDAKTKKPITQVTVANSDKELAYMMGVAIKSASK